MSRALCQTEGLLVKKTKIYFYESYFLPGAPSSSELFYLQKLFEEWFPDDKRV